MDDICRLCCSTAFVNNNIFDEENALNLKMALYLPIKVFRNDRLPQKICDKCSCKVNDLYQFCNETIEVQKRLQSMLQSDLEINGSIDLSLIKHNSESPHLHIQYYEQSTQTEDVLPATDIKVPNDAVKVKEEPRSVSPEPVKQEFALDNDDNNDFPDDIPSDNSDDMSLHNLKMKKKSKKVEVNGEVTEKRGRKKKPKIKDWNELINVLPEGTTVGIVDKSVDKVTSLTIVKEEDVKESERELLIVKQEDGDMDLYHCCICFMQCFSRSDMLQHYRSHVPAGEAWAAPPAAPPPPDSDPLRCVRCRKVLTRSEWGGHWARHWERDRRPYRCALCEKTFRDPHQILKHGQSHKLGEEGAGAAQPLTKRFVCDLCPEGFVYMRHLLSHRLRGHPEAAARPLALRCGQCSRSFAHLNSLRRHLRAHSGERNFLCNVCGKALSSREHLKFHIRIHTGYKPNVCKTCGKGFVKKCNLTLHERVHSGEKPHVCSHCGKAFSQRSTLVIHERYHSGARPYSCGLCGRGFVAKGLLSMHLKTTCI